MKAMNTNPTMSCLEGRRRHFGFTFTRWAAALSVGVVVCLGLGGARPASGAEPHFLRVEPPGFTADMGIYWPIAWGDYDGDGHLDMFIPRTGADWKPIGNLLYRNNGDGSFTSKTADEAGPLLEDVDLSVGAFWADANNDGRLDLLVQNMGVASGQGGPIRLYLNQGGGRFSSMHAGALTGSYLQQSAWGNWCDYDGDGWLDGFVAGGGTDTRILAHLLFQGRGDGAFDLAAEGTLPLAPRVNSMPNNSLWTDLDGDGDPDLLVANTGARARDMVFRNDRRGQFTRLTNNVLDRTNHWTFHYVSADLDNDGDIDVVSAANTNRIYLNDGTGTFILSQNLAGIAGPMLGDYDNDGDVDLMMWGGGEQPRLYRNDGTGRFDQVEEAFTMEPWGTSSFVDVDNDGFLDVPAYKVSGSSRPTVLFRNQGNGNHWIKFRLVGTASNRSAIGAKVRVKAILGGRTIWQVRELYSHINSEDGLRAHFGLADATEVEEVVVEWPSGNIDRMRNLPANQVLDVTETASIQPTRPVVTANGNVSLGKRTGQVGETYQWYHDGEPLPDGTGLTLSLTTVQSTQAGRYSLVTRNGELSATNHVYLRVLEAFTKVLEGEIVTEEFGSDNAVWFDMDGNGWLDVFVPHDWDYRGLADSLFRNRQDGTFAKVLDSPVTVRARGSTIASAADYDNDGNVDLFVNRAEGDGELFRNRGGGQFISVPGPFNSPHGQGFASSWGDYDRDGDLDLLVAYGYAGKNDPEALYRNNGDGTFTELTAAEVGTVLSDRFVTWTCALSDLDNDGWPDALVQHLSGLRLHRNNRDGTFTRITHGSLANSRTDDMFTLGDYDNDGDLDILATRLSNGTAGIHRNLGRFTFEFVLNAGDLRSSKLPGECYPAWGDYDNDGWLDLFVAGYTTTNLMFRNRGDGTFQSVDAGNLLTDGVRRGFPLWVDYDNNGFLDLMLTCGDYAVEEAPGVPNHLYRNPGNGNRWLKIKLVGTTSNRDGVGAKVRVKATIHGRTFEQMREIAGYAGWVGTVPLMAHFGLGDATLATSVRIEWPSGIVQVQANVAANQMLTVTEPEVIQLTCSHKPDGLHITCRGLPNTSYQLQLSANLKNWVNVNGVLNTDADGLATQVELGTDPARFYRVVKR